jgi:DNA-binding Xre family transcriptional regulator
MRTNKNSSDNHNSSLKNIINSRMSPQEIISKYENVLASREAQLTQLTKEMGVLNNRVNDLNAKMININKQNLELINENNDLKQKLIKKDKYLETELSSKEIMFMRLQNKEVEYDNLLKKYNELTQNSDDKKNEENIQESIFTRTKNNFPFFKSS